MAVNSVDQEGADEFTGLFVGHYQQLLRLAVLFLGDLPAAALSHRLRCWPMTAW